MQYPGDCGVGGEETCIGDFHHFVGNRRYNRLVTTINDIGEPVAIGLEECLIAVYEWPIGCYKEERDQHLQQRDDKAGGKGFGCSGYPKHGSSWWKGSGNRNGPRNQRLVQSGVAQIRYYGDDGAV